MLPQLRAQQASNVLWACAKLSLNPDSAVSGLTAQLIGTVAAAEHIVAQDISNTVWAVAILKDAGQLATVDMEMVSSMCTRFMDSVNSQLTDKPAKSQEVSNLLWAAATSPACACSIVELAGTLQ